MTSLDLLQMFGKSKNYSPKWWFNGGLPWKIQQITFNISKCIYIYMYINFDWTCQLISLSHQETGLNELYSHQPNPFLFRFLQNPAIFQEVLIQEKITNITRMISKWRWSFVFRQAGHLSHEKKNQADTFHWNPVCLIGIPIMVYYNPHIAG